MSQLIVRQQLQAEGDLWIGAQRQRRFARNSRAGLLTRPNWRQQAAATIPPHLLERHCAPVAAGAERCQQRLGRRQCERTVRLCLLSDVAEDGPQHISRQRGPALTVDA